MQIAVIGLGRMGGNIVRRLERHGHQIFAYDINALTSQALLSSQTQPVAEVSDLSSCFEGRRVIWIMLPASVTATMVDQLSTLLSPGDVVIDGGNSHFKDDILNAETLKALGVHFVDVGTSGGIHGLERGYSLMVGGDPEVVASLAPIFDALAPGQGAAKRTPSRTGAVAPEEQGWLHCGPVGAGHFVKMVHNGIEYGMMQSLTEGLALLEGYPAYEFDIPAITEVWRRGSVIASWLLDLTADALHRDPTLSRFTGNVPDSGEGRWTVEAALESATPIPVLATSLWSRFTSRGHADFGNKALSAMREAFGGHREDS